VLDGLLRLFPVVLGIVVGVWLRRSGAADQRDGEFVFNLNFYVSLPALLFTSLSRSNITADLAVFPAAAVAMAFVGYLAARVVVARTSWPPTQAAVLLSSCIVVNSGFELPFVQAFYGAEGVARLAAFDLAMTTVTFSFAYYVAARGNPHHEGGGLLLNRLVRSPPLYGIAAGALVNLTGVPVPAALADPIAAIGAITPVLITLATGLLLEPPGRGLGRAFAIITTRLLTGILIAVALVLVLGLDGVDRAVVLLLGVAPLAFISVTFASLENLDVRLAVSALSLSLVTSLVLSSVVLVLTA
jgi:hypothetical protein